MTDLIWNKASDYSRGYTENLCFDGGILRMEDCTGKRSGIFLSGVIDSGEKGTVWHRLVMDAWIGENMAISVIFFATDSDRLIEGQGEGLSDRLIKLKPVRMLESLSPQDILLHQVRGRYLFVGMKFWGDGKAGPYVRQLRIFYPKEVLNSYLPEIYQGNKQEFLERFLSIFQSVYEDMARKIRQDTSFLDLQASKKELLLWLAQWIHVENRHLWKEENLRRYLLCGASCFGQRGTVRGLIRMVRIFTGEEPYLVEAKKGENPDSFSVLIKESAIADLRSFRAVERLIGEGKPADMQVSLIPLRPYLFLDQHTYLGINSRLNHYGQAVLTPESAFDFTVLGGKQDEESDLHAI